MGCVVCGDWMARAAGAPGTEGAMQRCRTVCGAKERRRARRGDEAEG